jgi:hypothetical protein
VTDSPPQPSDQRADSAPHLRGLLKAAGAELGYEEGGLDTAMSAWPRTGQPWRPRLDPASLPAELSYLRTASWVTIAYLSGMRDTEIRGKVVLNRAVIEGRLWCSKGRFDCPAPTEDNMHGHAIEAISATVRDDMELGWQSVSPSVAFTNATTSYLADNPANWPARFIVSGFSYDRFEQPQSVFGEPQSDRGRRHWTAGTGSPGITRRDVHGYAVRRPTTPARTSRQRGSSGSTATPTARRRS